MSPGPGPVCRAYAHWVDLERVRENASLDCNHNFVNRLLGFMDKDNVNQAESS